MHTLLYKIYISLFLSYGSVSINGIMCALKKLSKKV
jgi:hypothetical protein